MSYYESRIPFNLNNASEMKKLLNWCKRLRIYRIILDIPNHFKKIPSEISELIMETPKVKIFYRTTLHIKDMRDFNKKITKYSDYPYIMSIEATDKEIQLKAAKDSRIDLISYSNQSILKTLTPGLISLVKQNESFLEFSLASLFISERKTDQSKNFRNLYRNLNLARKSNVNFIISGYPQNVYMLRHPRNLISLCHTLLDLPLSKAKEAFSKSPEMLIRRVENRSNQKIIENGVRIVKQG